MTYFRTVFLAAADLDGQSTFGMKENEESKEIPLQIKEAANVFKYVSIYVINIKAISNVN